MKIKSIGHQIIGVCGLAALALSATTTFAEPEVHESIKIAVKTDDGLDETVNIENLAVGESEYLMTDSGREVLVTRTDDGLELDIDGKLIEVKLPDGAHGEGKHHMMIMSDEDEMHHSMDADRKFVIIEEDEEILGENVIIKRIYKSTDGDFDISIDDMDLHKFIEIDGDNIHVIDIDVDADDVHGDEKTVIIIKKRIEKHVEITEDDG